MNAPGFRPYSAGRRAVLKAYGYTSRDIEPIDMTVANLARHGTKNLTLTTGDVSKSGYRIPVNHTDRLPTLTTHSKIFHFGLATPVSPWVQLASYSYLLAEGIPLGAAPKAPFVVLHLVMISNVLHHFRNPFWLRDFLQLTGGTFS